VAPEFRAAETLLEVNNIEVIYNHVILVLKGVSLKVPKGGITALLGGNGAGKTTTLKAISNLLHSERGEVTKGSIRYRGERVAGPEPVRPGRARRDPGDGGAPLLRAPDGRGEPPDRRLHAQGRARRDRCGSGAGLHLLSAPEGAAEEPGGLYLGRRAADDGDRPRADEPARDDPAGRAVDGPRAAAGGSRSSTS
jgi:ABC-type dipeptide/oligopeptide/nickel transport system ATPase component